MNWKDILKEQFATTADAQFELDFENPMIEQEEETCKKKLRALYNKLKNMSAPSGFIHFSLDDEDPAISRDFRKRFLLDGKGARKRRFMVSGRDSLEKVPEEICCKAIELFKIATDDNDAYDNGAETGYEIYVEKNYSYSSMSNRKWCDSIYTIEIRGPNNKTLYVAELRFVARGTNDINMVKEKLAAIAEPLFNF